MRKILSLMVAAVLGISTAFATTVYCKMTQSWWTQDGAAVAVYHWGGATAGTAWPGVRMASVAGEEGLWSYDVPADVTGLIFVRVNGSGAIADWGAKTGDLTLPTDGKNLFTITNEDATWGDPGCTGEWSTYGGGADADFTKPFTLKFNGNGTSDNSNSFKVSDGVAAIFNEASAPYVSALKTVENVYAARTIADDPSSLKFGTSSKKGTLAFTLGKAIEVDSIILNATQYGNNAAKVSVNTVEFDLTAGNKIPQDCKITPTEAVSEITIAQSGSERIYVRYVKVYPKTVTPEPPAPAAKFFITGDSALVVDAGLAADAKWNPAAIKSMETSYKLNLKANVAYKLKITLDGDWKTAKGFDDLTTTADGLYADNDNNICFSLNTASEVNVHYDGEFFFLNGDFYVAPAPEKKYYLKNNWDGAADWTWKEMTKEDGYYSLINVVFGGTGVNISSDPENEEDPKFIAAEDIETFLAYEPSTLGALDTVVFFFDPEAVNQYTGANGLTAQIIGKYVKPEQKLTDGYYLVGTMNEWTPAAEYLFAANPDKEGEYQLMATLAENDALKVVRVEADAIQEWYPQEAGDYTVDKNHAGATTIYFRPDYQGDENYWYAKCIYVTPLSTVGFEAIQANGKAVKVLYNGQIMIMKGDKTYTVQGQLVK